MPGNSHPILFEPISTLATYKDIGDRLAERFVKHTMKDMLKPGADKATQTLVFRLLASISSGILVFGLMYGLDSLLIADVIASYGAYLALFSVGLLLKNVMLGWLTKNNFPHSFDRATFVLLLTFLARSFFLLNTLFIGEVIMEGFSLISFIIFYGIINFGLGLDEPMAMLSLFNSQPIPEVDVSSINSLLSSKWSRVPVALLLTFACMAQICRHVITTPISLVIKLLFASIRWVAAMVFLPVGKWLYDVPQSYLDLTIRGAYEIKDITYNTVVNNPIRYWVARWLDIMNFSPRWNQNNDDFINLKKLLDSCQQSKGLIDLAERIAVKEIQQGRHMTPKDHLSFLLTDYLAQNCVSTLFKRPKPDDAAIAKKLLDELRNDSSTIHSLHDTLKTHQASNTLSKPFAEIALYVECLLVPMEEKTGLSTVMEHRMAA